MDSRINATVLRQVQSVFRCATVLTAAAPGLGSGSPESAEQQPRPEWHLQQPFRRLPGGSLPASLAAWREEELQVEENLFIHGQDFSELGLSLSHWHGRSNFDPQVGPVRGRRHAGKAWARTSPSRTRTRTQPERWQPWPMPRPMPTIIRSRLRIPRWFSMCTEIP